MGPGERGKAIKQKRKTHRHKQQRGDYQRVGVGEGSKEGKEGINGDGRRLDFGW